MITAVDCTIMRFSRRLMISEFFNFYSQSRAYLSAVDEETTGTTRKRISRSKLSEIPIPVPPLPEQRRIVVVLDEAFAGLESMRANAEKNLKNARELIATQLNCVFTHKGDGWVKQTLRHLCKLISGQHIEAKYYNTASRGIGYLTGPSDFGLLNPVVTKWTEFPKVKAKAGDILVTVKGSGSGKSICSPALKSRSVDS